MRKQIKWLCVIFIMTIMLLTAGTEKGQAEEKTEQKDWKYGIETEAGETYACIYAYLGNESDVVVPNELEGYPVREVMLNTRDSDDMIRYEQIKSVVFPDTAIAILSVVCMYFTNLTDVTIPEGVQFIGGNVFFGCQNLQSLVIPASVTYMEKISDNLNIVYRVQSGSYADTCLSAEKKRVERTGIKVTVTGISFEGEQEYQRTVSFDRESGDRILSIEAVIEPSGASNRQIIWSVDNPEILTLKDSLALSYGQKAYVNVRKGGQAVVTATTADGGYTAKYCIDAEVDITCHEIRLEKDTYEYDGTEKCPAVIIPELKEGVDYLTEYSNNVEAGTGVVTIRGLGGNTGSTTRSFTIKQKKADEKKENVISASKKKISVKTPAGLKVKNIKKKKSKLTWKKVNGASGYEIYRSTKKSGKYKRIKTGQPG